jgi:hypothetical protein
MATGVRTTLHDAARLPPDKRVPLRYDARNSPIIL